MGTHAGEINMWEVTNPRAPTVDRDRLFGEASNGQVMSVAFSPDGHRFIATSQSGTAQLIISTRSDRTRLKGSANTEAISFTTKIVARSVNGNLSFWNKARPDVVHLNRIRGADEFRVLHDDTMLVAASSVRQEVQLWDIANLLNLPVDAYNVEFVPDGHSVAVDYDDRVSGPGVRVWDLEPARIYRQMCASYTSSLDETEWAARAPNVPYVTACGGLNGGLS